MAKKFPTDRLKNRIAANADKIRKVLLILIALICVFAAVLNLTGLYNTDLNYLYFSNEGEIHFTSVFANMKQLYDTNFFVRNDFSGLETVNNVYGVANIALAVLAVAMIFFIGKSEKKQKPCKILSAVGLGISAAYVIAFVVWGISTITYGPDSMPYGAVISSNQYGSTQIIFAGIPLVTWILAALFLGLLCLGKFNKVSTENTAEDKKLTVSAKRRLMIRIVLLVLVGFCIVTSVLNICGTYEVSIHYVTKILEMDTYKEDMVRDIQSSYFMFNDLEIVNFVFGIVSGLFGIGAIILLLRSFRADVTKSLRMFTYFGFAIHALYIYAFSTIGSETSLGLGGGTMLTVDVHFITWINVALFAALFVVPLIKIKNPNPPAVETTETTAE